MTTIRNESTATGKVEVSTTITTSDTVEAVDNHIYFYADVTTSTVLSLMKILRETDARLQWEIWKRNPYPYIKTVPVLPIYLHIMSNGGELFGGLSLADQIPTIISPVHTIVEGICASAATLISMSGNKRYMLTNGFMMIHQPSTSVWGTYQALKDHAKLADMAMEKLIQFYINHSKSDRRTIEEVLSHDTYLSASEALEYGFIDEIV